MRDPYNISNIGSDRSDIHLKIDNLPEYDIDDYDLNDPKDFEKYIIDIKRSIRNSFEYKQMIKYLRENLDMNKCSVYENVNNIDSFKIKIEIHHHPFSLEDICRIVYRKRMALYEDIELEMVAKEVMYLHYLLYVGLIPLSQTVHELVHANSIFIPIDKVIGKFREFENMYGRYMDAEQMDKFERNVQYSETYIEGLNNILNKKYVYIDTDDVYDTPDLNQAMCSLKSTLDGLKNHKKVEIVKYDEQNIPVKIFVKA